MEYGQAKLSTLLFTDQLKKKTMRDTGYTVSEHDLMARIEGFPNPYDRYSVVRWKSGTTRRVAQELGLQDLRPAKRDLPAGFRYLVNLTTGAVVAPALLFLAEQAVGIGDEKHADNTISAYAYDLRAWFEFLATMGVAWDAATEHHFRDYVYEMTAEAFDEETEQGFQFARSTIKRRVSSLRSFYADARSRGLTDVRFVTKLGKTIGRSPETAIRPVPLESLKPLIACFGPRPSKRRDGETSRLWLSSMIALLGGLRRFEVCGLDRKQIEKVRNNPWAPLAEHAIDLTVTKGGNPRTILLPGFLIAELKLYIAGERAACVPLPDDEHTSALFVNHRSAGPAAGDRLSPAILGREFSAAVARAGLLRQLPGHRHGAGASTTAHTFHDLRHTCACLYYVNSRGHSADPWLEAQRRLGHALLETTQKVYLRHVHEFAGGADDLVQSIVFGLLG